jgi:hypothetical protein
VVGLDAAPEVVGLDAAPDVVGLDAAPDVVGLDAAPDVGAAGVWEGLGEGPGLTVKWPPEAGRAHNAASTRCAPVVAASR